MKLGSFHSKEFTGMMFNVERIPEDTSVLSFYKELNKIKEFKQSAGEGIDNDKLMLFVMLMYDRNSPYRIKFSEPLKRKIEIAHDVGFETIDGGVFADPVEDFLKGRNPIVNNKIVQYVRLHRNYNYSYQVSVEAAYFNLMLEIQAGETKSIKQAGELRDELERNLSEMLNGDNNPLIKDEMLRFMENDRLALRPEDYAKRAREGERHPKPKRKK